MGRAFNDISAAHGAVAVTVSDTTVIPATRGLWVGTSGNIAVRMVNGDAVTFASVPVGYLPVQVDMVKSTDTTADDIIALY